MLYVHINKVKNGLKLINILYTLTIPSIKLDKPITQHKTHKYVIYLFVTNFDLVFIPFGLQLVTVLYL
jgi:hypothetical protein